MFGLSTSHLLILGLVALLFGARRLPELGAGLGNGIRAFKAALGGLPLDASNPGAPQEPPQIAKNASAGADRIDKA